MRKKCNVGGEGSWAFWLLEFGLLEEFERGRRAAASPRLDDPVETPCSRARARGLTLQRTCERWQLAPERRTTRRAGRAAATGTGRVACLPERQAQEERKSWQEEGAAAPQREPLTPDRPRIVGWIMGHKVGRPRHDALR